MAVIGDRIEHEIHISASPETVFAFFTDPDQHIRWMGLQATLDPTPGGIYRVQYDHATALGEFVTVEPPHRIVFTWGFIDNHEVPGSSSTVEVTLVAERGGTTVRLAHTGLPHPALSPHDQGWRGHLAQLATSAAAPAS